MRLSILAISFVPAVLLFAEPPELRLIEVDPGHSHAAALHNTMLVGFSQEAHVYAPLGTDLTEHLDRIVEFNNRARNPTHWALRVYAGPDYLQKLREEPPGNVVVLSGRNKKKIDYIMEALRDGQNVLADKPWIIDAKDFSRLETALNLAEKKGLVAYDCMTQRFDAAYQLQRALVSDREIFGEPIPGTPDAPSVRMENMHALLKMGSAGPSLRPAWFFDIQQQGEGIADVGTHLVDLVEWTLFADRVIDYKRDIRVIRADRSPLMLTREQFQRVTGKEAWPPFLRTMIKEDRLQYFTNNNAVFSICGIHVYLRVRWQYEAPVGAKDSYFASYRGTRSRIELREGSAEHYVPEVFVIPGPENRVDVLTKLKKKLPQFTVEQNGGEIHVVIPERNRTPDERYFALLVERFLSYIRRPEAVPAWEKPNMIAKYYVTTKAVQLAREGRP